MTTQAASVSITGEVSVQGVSGQKIENVEIYQQSTGTLLTKTDSQGSYTISAVDDQAILRFRHVDYDTVSVAVSDLTQFVPVSGDPTKRSGDFSLRPTTNTNPKMFQVRVRDELGRLVKLNFGSPPKQSFDEIFVTKERSNDGGSDWGKVDYEADISEPNPGLYQIEGRGGYRLTGSFLEFRKNGYQKNYLFIPDLEDGKTYELILKTETAENTYQKKKFLPLSDAGLDPIIKKNILLDAGNEFEPDQNLGSNEYAIQQTFFQRILPRIYRIIGALGIFYLLIVGIQYIFSNGESDRITKQKDAVIWIVVGLMVVSIAEFIGFSALNPDKNILAGETLPDFQAKTHQIIRYIEYIGGGIFLLNGVLSGYSIIFSTNEEVANNQKKFMVNFALGVLFILTAEIIVRVASNYDGVNGTLNIAIGEVGSLINLILSFLAGASGFMLILASMYYVANFGNEEQTGRAKKIIIGCISGLVIAFSSYVIAQFLVIWCVTLSLIEPIRYFRISSWAFVK